MSLCKYASLDMIACVCVGVKEEEGLLLGDAVPLAACVLAV